MEDLVGQTFNRLTVLKYVGVIRKHSSWLCCCACGNEVIVTGSHLKTGHTKSCGCVKKEKLQDITGQIFGLWTVVSFSHFAKSGNKQRPYWNCKCACGNEGVVRGDVLKSGGSKSCGCYEKDRSLIELPEYTEEEALKKAKSIYKHMKQRCYNFNNTRIDDYGGRGIKICDRWLESFENFYEDMGTPPTNLHQLDRIDNEGDYSPNNCKWSTHSENNRNKRDSHMITYNRKTQCVTAWAEDINIDAGTLFDRIARGWDNERVITTPLDIRFSRAKNKVEI